MILDKTTTRLQILLKYNNRCAYCGDAITIETLCIDHIIPLLRRKGPYKSLTPTIKGTNSIENLNPACLQCNSSKNCKSLEEWRKTIADSINKIQQVFPRFRLLQKLNIIKITTTPIIFYFESITPHSNG